MIRFAGYYGSLRPTYSEKMKNCRLTPVIDETDISIFTNATPIDDYYLGAEGVHLLLSGIVTQKINDDADSPTHSKIRGQIIRVHNDYLNHGKQSLESLDGTFSAIVWDANRHTS